MSTRSVTIVRMQYDCAPFIALYRHCDGYPAEAGAAILEALQGASCPEQVAGKLLSMVYDSSEPMDRLRAVYHPTESADVHGDLEHVYEIIPTSQGWRIKHAKRTGWNAKSDNIQSWPTTNQTPAEFAELVNNERRTMNVRIAQLRKESPFYADCADYPMVEVSA